MTSDFTRMLSENGEVLRQICKTGPCCVNVPIQLETVQPCRSPQFLHMLLVKKGKIRLQTNVK